YLLMQSVYTEAVDLLNKGLSAEKVKQQLVAKGLQQQTASGVVEDILEQNRHPPPEAQESVKGMLLKLVGGVVFVVGIGLFFGHVSGAFPTFPYAGFVVMGIGGALWGAADL